MKSDSLAVWDWTFVEKWSGLSGNQGFVMLSVNPPDELSDFHCMGVSCPPRYTCKERFNMSNKCEILEICILYLKHVPPSASSLHIAIISVKRLNDICHETH